MKDAEIMVDWSSIEAVWRTAGSAFQKYPRRILTDFYIGAHAFEIGFSLLTLDDGIYRAVFPKLSIFSV